MFFPAGCLEIKPVVGNSDSEKKIENASYIILYFFFDGASKGDPMPGLLCEGIAHMYIFAPLEKKYIH